MHRGLQLFLAESGAALAARCGARLRKAMERALAEAGVRPALAEWWAPRLHRIADWVAEQEMRTPQRRRARAASPARSAGLGAAHAAAFVLRGRADRIERRADGRLAIIDYKTGTPPTQRAVDAGIAPQLPLEAAMARAGAFGPELAGSVAELTYWHLTGGSSPARRRRCSRATPTPSPMPWRTAETSCAL